MLNIEGVYSSQTFQGVRGETDADGNHFTDYICYGNRLLAKVYSIGDDDTVGSIIYIQKNGRFKKYVVYGYFNGSAIVGFILGVLYNGERESD